MWRYGVVVNYTQLRDNDKNKGALMYINGRPKASRNIVGFISNTQPGTTNKKPNFISDGHDGSHVYLFLDENFNLVGYQGRQAI